MASISQDQLVNTPIPSSHPQPQNAAPKPKKLRATPIKWNPQMEEAMLDALLSAQAQGLQTDNAAYKSTGWQMALDAVQKCTSYSVQLQQIKSKHDTHKKGWKAWKEFCNQSGFGWDYEKGVPTSSPDILDAHFEAHPEARKFRDKPLAFADKLAVLLDGHLATGDRSRTARELLAEANDESIEEDVDDSSLYESIESESVTDSLPQSTTRSTTMSPEPSRARTLAAAPSNLRKRSLENAAKAELKRQKKSGPHSLADAITDAVRELSTSREALVEGNKEPGQKVASILVSGEFNLTDEEQVTVFSAIKNEDMIDLFLARDKDGRKRFVEKVLAEIHGHTDNEIDLM
jgi:hypothetical protein